jgi:hypothetical protein
VVSIYRRTSGADPDATYEWTVTDGDVRDDREVADEVTAVLQRHHVKETVRPPRIMGCPHEEGFDYPLGRSCPHCPFWTTIDRFTHEPVQPPVATMSAEQVLAALSDPEPAEPPFDALESADAHRATLAQPLLDAMHACLANPQAASSSDAMRITYALYLFAKWRDTRVYPLVIRWLSLPGEEAFLFGDDVVTQDGGRILAAVCDGDLAPMTSLVLNRGANEWCRCAGVRALALLGAWAEVPGERIVEHFTWLAREGLEREPGAVWDELASASADIEAVPVFAELRRAYDEGLIDPHQIPPDELDEVEAAPPGAFLEDFRTQYPPIDDVTEAISWWGYPHDQDEDEDADGEQDAFGPAVETYRAPVKVGRNEPCPCGSGKKYKKCCAA